MNPTSSERGPQQLPTPIGPENLPSAIMPAPERAGSQSEAVPAVAGTLPPIPAILLPIPTAPLPIAPINLAGSSADSTTPAVADDVDLIEKEWVQRAKAIIGQTQNDPRQKSKELSIYKSDYVQKRFNKAPKLSE